LRVPKGRESVLRIHPSRRRLRSGSELGYHRTKENADLRADTLRNPTRDQPLASERHGGSRMDEAPAADEPVSWSGHRPAPRIAVEKYCIDGIFHR
jgi:hypothetical protein